MSIKVAMISLGCPKNQVEAEHMLALLADAGCELVGDASEAQVAVVNTCGFIDSAKQEAIDSILEMAALKQQVERMLQEARERRVRNERRSLNEALLRKLTAREQQVLERITAGRLNKQIADDLGISIKTVEAHRASIMDKTNSGTVADLMRVVLGAGLKQNDGL